MPRGTFNVNGKLESRLPSARKVSWELHHDDLYPLGNLADQNTLGSDPTCAPEKRFGGCDFCDEETCQKVSQPKPTCEFQQPCPKADDKTTAARLGGNGALATHMVWKILAKLFNTFLKVMQFGQFVAHSFSMTAQKGDLTEIFNQIK